MVILAGMKILKQEITWLILWFKLTVPYRQEMNNCAQHLSFTFIKALDINILRGGKWIVLLCLFSGNIEGIA